MSLIQQLVKLRIDQGWSQGEVAKRLRHTQSWVSKFESKSSEELTIGEINEYLNIFHLRLGNLSIVSNRSNWRVLEINPLEPTYCLKCLGKYLIKDMDKKPRKVIKLGACKNCGETL